MVGEIEIIQYDDVAIVCRKTRKNLKPNIYINTEFLSIGSSIRGNVIIVCRENKTIKSLSKNQAMKYIEFLKRASFNYDSFDKKGRYLLKATNNQFKNRGQFIIEKSIGKDDIFSPKDNKERCFDTDETLTMLLAIQSVILRFIKNNTD